MGRGKIDRAGIIRALNQAKPTQEIERLSREVFQQSDYGNIKSLRSLLERYRRFVAECYQLDDQKSMEERRFFDYVFPKRDKLFYARNEEARQQCFIYENEIDPHIARLLYLRLFGEGRGTVVEMFSGLNAAPAFGLRDQRYWGIDHGMDYPAISTLPGRLLKKLGLSACRGLYLPQIPRNVNRCKEVLASVLPNYTHVGQELYQFSYSLEAPFADLCLVFRFGDTGTTCVPKILKQGGYYVRIDLEPIPGKEERFDNIQKYLGLVYQRQLSEEIGRSFNPGQGPGYHFSIFQQQSRPTIDLRALLRQEIIRRSDQFPIKLPGFDLTG